MSTDALDDLWKREARDAEVVTETGHIEIPAVRDARQAPQQRIVEAPRPRRVD